MLSISKQLSKLEAEELCPEKKCNLFKHIFLTEVIVHMLINQLGRSKKKKKQEREGYSKV